MMKDFCSEKQLESLNEHRAFAPVYTCVYMGVDIYVVSVLLMQGVGPQASPMDIVDHQCIAYMTEYRACPCPFESVSFHNCMSHIVSSLLAMPAQRAVQMVLILPMNSIVQVPSLHKFGHKEGFLLQCIMRIRDPQVIAHVHGQAWGMYMWNAQ